MITEGHLVPPYDVAPQAQCPRCKQWQDDLDGFGVLACVACGYCSHPSVTDGVCGICEKRVDLPQGDSRAE